LSTREVNSIIESIDRWGPVKITFFGGEPLLRKDIAAIVRHASRKGIRTSLDTNGLLLDEGMVVELKKSGIGNINISIDSAIEDVHDALRQKKGCFTSAVGGVELCVKHKIPCLISTYASKRSVGKRDLEAIIQLAKDKGAKGVKILFPILSGEWREKECERLNSQEEAYVKSLLDPTFVYIEDALEMVMTRGKQCSALKHNLIYISPYGDLQPCPAIPISFGNVLHDSIEDIAIRMVSSPIFKKHKSCDACLMNSRDFRDSFFVNRQNKELPLHAEEFKV
jgi:MoaA/NifB/PqqE/SkfB family radical SAM enzyme